MGYNTLEGKILQTIGEPEGLKEYEDNLSWQVCPCCKSSSIDIDNWGVWNDKRDLFYYCVECDFTFNLEVDIDGKEDN